MSKVKPCPDGMTWVSAYLTVKDVDKMTDFYQKAFGFTKRFSMTGEGGKTTHAEVAHKDSTVMMGPESPDQGSKSPKALGGSPVTLYTYVEDVDALTRRARQAGATVVQETADQFWGDRTSLLIDPEGHQWMFATHVREVDPSEMKPPQR